MSNSRANVNIVEGIGLTADDVASCPYCVNVMESFEPLVIVEVDGARCLAHSSCHEEAEEAEDEEKEAAEIDVNESDDDEADDDDDEEQEEESGPSPLE